MMSDAELLEVARVRLLGRTVMAPCPHPPYTYRGQVIGVQMDEQLTHRPVVVIQALDYPMTGTLLADYALSYCQVLD